MEQRGNELYFSFEEQQYLPGIIPRYVELGSASLLSAQIDHEVGSQQIDEALKMGINSTYASRYLFSTQAALEAYRLARLIDEVLFS